MKSKYSIYEAKTHLSEIIRQVKHNRSVVITDRGHDVARVTPLHPLENLNKRLKSLQETGVITANPSADPSKIVPIARRTGALRRFLKDRNRF
jgi:prevent-host-death family protein